MLKAVYYIVLFGCSLTTSVRCLDVCEYQKDGARLAHPNDCTRFIQCGRGATVAIRYCPFGLHFNRYESICDFKFRAGCDFSYELELVGLYNGNKVDCNACRAKCTELLSNENHATRLIGYSNYPNQEDQPISKPKQTAPCVTPPSTGSRSTACASESLKPIQTTPCPMKPSKPTIPTAPTPCSTKPSGISAPTSSTPCIIYPSSPPPLRPSTPCSTKAPEIIIPTASTPCSTPSPRPPIPCSTKTTSPPPPTSSTPCSTEPLSPSPPTVSTPCSTTSYSPSPPTTPCSTKPSSTTTPPPSTPCSTTSSSRSPPTTPCSTKPDSTTTPPPSTPCSTTSPLPSPPTTPCSTTPSTRIQRIGKNNNSEPTRMLRILESDDKPASLITACSAIKCASPGKCAGQREGALFADDSSNGYIVCQCECEIRRPCPAGLVFNLKLQVCDWPQS